MAGMMMHLIPPVLILLVGSIDGGTLRSAGEQLLEDTWSQLIPGTKNFGPDALLVDPLLTRYTQGDDDSYAVVPLSSESTNTGLFYHCTHSGIFPVPGSCRGFYICEQLRESGMFSKSLSFCPLGTVFDVKTDSCEVVGSVDIRAQCVAEAYPTDINFVESYSKPPAHSSIESSIGDHLALRRSKRASMISRLTDIDSRGFLKLVLNDGIAVLHSTKIFMSLGALENYLLGIKGKINGINFLSLDYKIKDKFYYEVSQTLNALVSDNTKVNSAIIQIMIDEGLLENHIGTAKAQGYITQENNNNNSTFVQVSIGKIRQFINRDTVKSQAVLKGFEMTRTSVDKSKVEPLVSTLLSLVTGFYTQLSHIQPFLERNGKSEIESFIGYLTSRDLYTKLNEIVQQKSAIPTSKSDLTAVVTLDLLVCGLQVEASLLSVVVSLNVYLATEALKQKNLNEFNTHMSHLRSAVHRVKYVFGYGGRIGLITGVKGALSAVENLPFSGDIERLRELLVQKKKDVRELETVVENLVKDNTEIKQPGIIIGEPNFSKSTVSLPVGPWEIGKRVSYAIQLVSVEGLSQLGKWSPAYVLKDKACPTIQLPVGDTNSYYRLLYRRFNEETPELVGIVRNHEQILFRDVSRDILNIAAKPHGENAARDIRQLISGGGDVNVSLENNITPLHLAAKHGGMEVMKILRNKHHANINAKAIDNQQALHFAALFGTKEGVAYLISEGAQLNAQTGLLGLSPLHIAVANSKIDATRILIQKGANINIKDKKGLTPLHISVAGNGDTINTLLEYGSLAVNAVAENGLTPLHYAARSSSEIFVQRLLQHVDVNVNAVSDSLVTPIHLASVSGNQIAIAELIRNGANYNSPDNVGSTPLHYASFYGKKDSVLSLLQMDISQRNIKNSEGQTALDIAVKKNYQEIAEILRSDEDKLISILKELYESQKSTDVISSTCSNEVVDSMASGSGNVCISVGHVNAYVEIVMGMIPLQVYYKNYTEFSSIFSDYDHNLRTAKSHAKIWKNGDSIVLGIRRTFQLAREFEPEFKRLYKINQQRIETIKKEADTVDIIKKIEVDIEKCKNKINTASATMKLVQVPAVKVHFQNQINEHTEEIQELQRQINEDFTIIPELAELVSFLEFVRKNALEIKDMASKTKVKLENFRDHLSHDKSAFVRDGGNARDYLKKLADAAVARNAALKIIKDKRNTLRIEIAKHQKEVSALYVKMNKSHAKLRELRLKLMNRRSRNLIMGIFGAILVPFVIGIPLLVVALVDEKKVIALEKSTLENDKVNTASILASIKQKTDEMETASESIAKSQRNTEGMQVEMLDSIKLDRDLNTLSSKVDTLVEAITQAMAGADTIKDVFISVELKLGKMIKLATDAKTEAERMNARYFVYHELTDLQCNWRDISLKVMNLDECTRNFKFLHKS